MSLHWLIIILLLRIHLWVCSIIQIFLYGKNFLLILYLGDMDIRVIKFIITYALQSVIFILLCNMGLLGWTIHAKLEPFEQKLYSFANDLLISFQITFGNICSDLTDQSCSLPMNINPYFFSTKLALIYYALLIIVIIYTWHETVRLSSCFFALLIITIIIFGTDLALISDKILLYAYTMCTSFFISSAALRAGYIPENIDISLHVLYEPNMSIKDWCKFLQNDTSISAYFCRWVKRTKKKLNIEEKLILSTIIGLIIFIITIIMCVYDLYSK